MILRGTPATISIQFLDGDNPADPGATTIKVDRGDGTNLVPALTATGGTGTNPRTFTLTTTHTAAVDVLKASWTSATHGVGVTYHPVVGAFYVDLQTLRNTGDLSDQAKFTDETLDAARDWWLTLVDSYCGQSFVPMWRLWKSPYPWRGGPLRLDRPHVRGILSAKVGTTTVDVTGWVASDSGRVYTATGGNPTVTGATGGFLHVAFEHGRDQPDPELYQTGVKAMRGKLLDDRTGGPLPRQLSVTTEFGTTRIAQPGEDRATPWPDVNAVLNRRRAATEIVSIGA